MNVGAEEFEDLISVSEALSVCWEANKLYLATMPPCPQGSWRCLFHHPCALTPVSSFPCSTLPLTCSLIAVYLVSAYSVGRRGPCGESHPIAVGRSVIGVAASLCLSVPALRRSASITWDVTEWWLAATQCVRSGNHHPHLVHVFIPTSASPNFASIHTRQTATKEVTMLIKRMWSMKIRCIWLSLWT